MVFFNTLTADDKFPVQCCENFELTIQMQFSQKRKTFSQLLVHFPESTSSFKHSEKKKDEAHSSTISDIIDSERSSYLNVLKAVF